METLNLIQGSPAWHAHRATHFNASDAPAMLGCSPYKTRTQLLHEMATGQTPDVDAATQRRFDYGHRFEALARPLAEEFIGEELYPVVGAEGKLSASFDGLTMDESTGFEHKTLNAELRAAMSGQDDGSALPAAYRAQMEQQLMISGAQKILFMASSWRGDELIEEMHCWYESDQAMREALMQGWAQFAVDLEAYAPAVVEAKPVGRTPETLPALHIEVTGMVTASNLAEFKSHALEVFGAINTVLVTDQDFADAEKTVKWCGEVEQRLAAAKEHALSQTASIDALFKAIDDISAEARRVRLELNKKVDAEKVNRRNEIQQGGARALAEHVTALNKRLGQPYMPTIAAVADFAGAMKNKRSLDSMKDAVATTLAKAKIDASAIADRIQSNMQTLSKQASEHAFLFPDVAQLVLKAGDDLAAVITARIAEHQAKERAKEEAQRERIRQEELARIQREQAAAAVAAAPAPAPIAQPAAAPTVIPMTPRVQPSPSGVPTLRLGVLNERLAPVQVSADGLASLGFKGVKDRGAVLFHESDFPHICAALVDHLQRVQAKQAA
jgi:putative phage-type endonuclease